MEKTKQAAGGPGKDGPGKDGPGKNGPVAGAVQGKPQGQGNQGAGQAAGQAKPQNQGQPGQGKPQAKPQGQPGQGKPQAKPQGQPGQGKPAAPAAAPEAIPQAAGPARARFRHVLLLLSFLLWVAAPLGTAGWYLYTVAADQYASHVGFSVRKEEVGSAIELLGGITELSGSSSSDTDILFEFIQSQQMVRAIKQRIDLGAIYSKPEDPVFGLGDDARIEALSTYWQRMVKVFYDRASGLIEIRVLAFDPENAHAIATAIFDESSDMINRLSAIARSDATRYAEEELALAITRLKAARTAMTAFRNRNQIVDPAADIQGQMGLLNSLNGQMAAAQIELALLLDNSSEGDPRVQQARRKVEAIQKLIDEERSRFGDVSGQDGGAADENSYSRLIEEYEVLEVDLEFAQKSFLSAQATRDVSVAEAQRKSRYLATHIEPTLAETSEYPRRIMLLSMLAVFLFISWAILVMIYYSLRDRR